MKTISQAEVMSHLKYNPETGFFTWLKSSGKAKRGSIAGTKNDKGYIQIRLHGVGYLAHRLAWVYVAGESPQGDMDHINRVKDDNRFVNLRVVTKMQNCENKLHRSNCKSGFVGVGWSNGEGKWQARLVSKGVKYFLGYYDNFEQAKAARIAAVLQHQTHYPVEFSVVTA